MYQNDFNFSFPLQKIDQEKRIVTGIATAANIDLAGEIVDFEASKEAFSNWIGNIREMHNPLAVGKLVDWRPTKIFHEGIVYDAIEVDVYISKGAEDTWQKILDGTLRGFSIGGKKLEVERKFDPISNNFAVYITKYMLGELSVVDNPCNPAGMFMLIKMADNGSLEMVGDETKRNVSVYYCHTHNYATIDENKYCPSCSNEMTKIGFVEEFNSEVISKMISDFEHNQKGKEIMDLHKNEEGDTISPTMNDLTEPQKESVLKSLGNLLFGTKDEAVAPTTNVVVNIDKSLFEKAAPEAEVSAEEEVVKEVIEEAVEKSVPVDADSKSDQEEEDMNTEDILKGISTLLDEKLEGVKKEISAEVDEKLATIQKSVDDFKVEAEESLEKTNEEIAKVSNTGAIQKSVDIDEEADEDKIEKSAPKETFWGGIFVPQPVVAALGYDS